MNPRGAQCVFLAEFKGKDDKPLPVIVQKTDGGYLYATTDLAAIRYRVRVLHAQRVLYVVDVRQSLHFEQVFAVARKAGFAPESVRLEHVSFGAMLGGDGRPLKTRTGGTLKLMDLLDEAEQRAYDVVAQKNPDLSEEAKRHVARVVGIGAVKYADLSKNRTSDYKFSWDKMLNLEGNTAPYMQYAYARVRSIFRKGAGETGGGPAGGYTGEPTDGPTGGVSAGPILLAEPAEMELAKRALRLEEVLSTVSAECKPNAITSYLYDLAAAFSTFYESCPVLKADQPLAPAGWGCAT